MSRIPVPVGEEFLVCTTVEAGDPAYCDCDPTREPRYVCATDADARFVGAVSVTLTCPRGRHPVVVRIVPPAESPR